MRIADRLRQLALNAGVGERQVKSALAEIGGIKYQAVQQWFGSNNPAPDNLAAIAKAYDANLMWIITGEGEMYQTTLEGKELDVVGKWREFPEDSRRMILAQHLAFMESLKGDFPID